MGRGSKDGGAKPPADSSTETLDGWLWWRSGNSRRSRTKEAYDALDSAIRAELKARMTRYQAGTTRQGDVKPLGDGVLELRYSHRNNQYRLLFARWGRYGLVLDVFFKNQEKTDRVTAVSRLKSWMREHGSGAG